MTVKTAASSETRSNECCTKHGHRCPYYLGAVPAACEINRRVWCAIGAGLGKITDIGISKAKECTKIWPASTAAKPPTTG